MRSILEEQRIHRPVPSQQHFVVFIYLIMLTPPFQSTLIIMLHHPEHKIQHGFCLLTVDDHWQRLRWWE